MDLAGKVAVVTGAARGIGRAITTALLTQKAKVCFCDINVESGSRTLAELQSQYGEGNVMFQACDVTQQQPVEDLFKSVKERFGCLDIVCNNAGVGGEVYPLWERTVDVNVKGTTRCTLLALEQMRTDRGGKGGVIINVSSAAGLNVNPLSPVYSATKAAIVALTRSLAMNSEVKSAGVRLNTLCPAFVDTDLVKEINEKNCLDVEKAHKFIEVIGVMTKEEVVESFMELVGDVNQNGAVLKCSKNGGKQYSAIEVKPVT